MWQNLRIILERMGIVIFSDSVELRKDLTVSSDIKMTGDLELTGDVDVTGKAEVSGDVKAASLTLELSDKTATQIKALAAVEGRIFLSSDGKIIYAKATGAAANPDNWELVTSVEQS